MGFGGIYIMMPVKVINRRCKECRTLDVGGSRDIIYGNDGAVAVENNLECRNLQTCLRAREIVMKSVAEDTGPEAGEQDA